MHIEGVFVDVTAVRPQLLDQLLLFAERAREQAAQDALLRLGEGGGAPFKGDGEVLFVQRQPARRDAPPLGGAAAARCARAAPRGCTAF